MSEVWSHRIGFLRKCSVTGMIIGWLMLFKASCNFGNAHQVSDWVLSSLRQGFAKNRTGPYILSSEMQVASAFSKTTFARTERWKLDPQWTFMKIYWTFLSWYHWYFPGVSEHLWTFMNIMVFPRCFPGHLACHLATIAYSAPLSPLLSHGIAGAGCQVYTTAQAPNLLKP